MEEMKQIEEEYKEVNDEKEESTVLSRSPSKKEGTTEESKHRREYSSKKLENIENSSDYKYIDENLHIHKDNTVYVTKELYNYIMEYLKFICDGFEKNKKFSDEMMERALQLRYIKIQNKLKRKKKKERLLKNKKEEHCVTKNCLDDTNPNEETLSKEKGIELHVNYSDNSTSSCLFSESSCSDDSVDSFDSIDKEVAELFFDKQDLSKVKSLERSSSMYMKHVRELSMRYETGSTMNLEYFKRIMEVLIMKNDKSFYQTHLENAMEKITKHYSQENFANYLKNRQKTLRSDVLNSIFDIKFIPETEPIKHRIINWETSPQNTQDMNFFNFPAKSGNRVFAEKKSSKNCREKNEKKSRTKLKQTDGRDQTHEDNSSILLVNGKKVSFTDSTIESNENGKEELDSHHVNEENKDTASFSEKEKGRDTRQEDMLGKNGHFVGRSSRKNLEVRKKEIRVRCLKQQVIKQYWEDLSSHIKDKQKFFEKNCILLSGLDESNSKRIDCIKKKMQNLRQRQEKQRLKYLRENNMDAYKNLLSHKTNKLLIDIVDSTKRLMTRMTNYVLSRKEKKDATDISTDVIVGNNIVDREISSEVETHKYEEDETVVMEEPFKNARNQYYELCHKIDEKVKQPSILVGGTLKLHQLQSLHWLVSLYNNNVNGILADDMGLGKTIQIISLFAYIKEFKDVPNFKAIIVVPLSVLLNWADEFKKWAPSIKILSYHDNKVERQHLKQKVEEGNFEVCITSFDIMMMDKSTFIKVPWEYIVVDEAHRMKNINSRFRETVSLMKCKHRLLLTGTPLQNNISELWALLNFLLPDLFSSCKEFEQWFDKSINGKSLEDEITTEEQLLIINRLHSVLYPFILRRVKQDVGLGNLKKEEYNVFVEPSLSQKILNEQIQNGFVSSNKVKSANPENGIPVRNSNIDLRKVADHPFIFVNEYTVDEFMIRSCGKFEVLDRMLPKLLKFKHKILIFSQRTQLLNILEDFLELKNYPCYRVDGEVKIGNRQCMFNEFNETSLEQDPSKSRYIFLISTKSGCTGINLQGADTVILYDSDQNPHQDLQAIARSYRMGQQSIVKVFRFIVRSSIECKILKRAIDKLKINEKVIEAGCFNSIANEEERKNKLNDAFLKDLAKDLENYDKSTNPILLNYFMKRNDEELEYFLNFDKEYFGEEVYNQFYRLGMAEGIFSKFLKNQEESNLIENEQKNKNEDEAKNEKIEEQSVKTTSGTKKHEERELNEINEVSSCRKRKYSGTYEIDDTMEMRKKIKKESQIDSINEIGVAHSLENIGGEEDQVKKETKENHIENKKENSQSSSKQEIEATEGANNLENSASPRRRRNNLKEAKEIDYESLLDEKNYNEIERLLIQSKKLMSKEEVPAYLLIQPRKEEELIIPDYCKRTRRQVTNIDYQTYNTSDLESDNTPSGSSENTDVTEYPKKRSETQKKRQYVNFKGKFPIGSNSKRSICEQNKEVEIKEECEITESVNEMMSDEKYKENTNETEELEDSVIKESGSNSFVEKVNTVLNNVEND